MGNRKDFGVKTYLYPMPVLIIATYDENGIPDAMNAAWGGICDYDKIIIDIGKHKTTENIALNKCFTVSVADEKYVTECDYVGVVSGKDVPDKISRAGFTVTKSKYINAPIINELPLCLECEVLEIIDGSKYIAKIVNVSADESVLGDDGEPDLSKFSPITFDPVHFNYINLGKAVGKAFSDGKKIK